MNFLRPAIKDVVYGGLYVLSRSSPEQTNAILMYHSVGPVSPTSVLEKAFSKQLQYLKHRLLVMSLEDLNSSLSSISGKGNLVSLTFDDGRLDNYDNALPILQDFEVKATFFIVAGLLGKTIPTSFGDLPMMSAQQVRELATAGHTIGAHTMTHPILTNLSKKEAFAEISDSKKALEDLVGQPVTTFAYPKGRHSDLVKELVREAGFKCAVSVREDLVNDKADSFSLPRIYINRTMGQLQFRAKLSPALKYYERLRKRQ